jgi:phosphohistidine phosphatase SixA
VVAPELRVVTCDLLALDQFKPKKLSQLLWNLPVGGAQAPAREERSLAAVGHMPNLGQYLEWMIDAAAGSIRFAKAGAALVRFKGEPARGEARLEWLTIPEWLH